MYQVPKKSRPGLWLFIICLSGACAVCFGIGFATVKIKNSPPEDAGITMKKALSSEENVLEDIKNVSGMIDIPENKTPEPPVEDYYIVKSVDDEVRVYLHTNTGTELIKKLPVSLSDLPASDQAKLAGGIKIIGKTALAELIEDYCS